MRAFDGVVGAEMDVGSVGRKFDFVSAGKARELFRFGGGRYIVGKTFFQFTDGLGGPGAGMENVNGLSGKSEIHRGHGELHASAALDEDDRVVV